MISSRGWAAVGLLYIYRRHGPALGEGARALRGNRRLIQALRSLEGPKFRLSAALVRPILAAHGDDMAWMEERLGEPLPVRLADDAAGSVGSEDDLLRLTPAAVDWLVAHTDWRPSGDEAAPGLATLEAVARALHGLRGRGDEDDDAEADDDDTELDEGRAGGGRRKRGARAAKRRAAQAPPPDAAGEPPARVPAPRVAPLAAPLATGSPAESSADWPSDWPADPQVLARVRQLHPELAVNDAALRDIVAGVLHALHQTLAAHPKSLQLSGLGHFTTRGGGTSDDAQDGRVRILLKLQEPARPPSA